MVIGHHFRRYFMKPKVKLSLEHPAGGEIQIEEFLMGCLRLRGHARAIDVEKIIYDQSWLIRSPLYLIWKDEVKTR